MTDATMVTLPPRTSSIGSSAASGGLSAALVKDPEVLLDSIDSTGRSSRKDGDVVTTSITPSTTDTDFDPIAFLNQHYETEHQLITALPSLRTAISSRLTHLDDSLSTTLRHQAALAPMIAQDVMHARNAVLQLATRIKDVKEQAQKSEEAVLQITKDMKRLDYAKRHLQRTITALKRLHMLLHATEQLRVATVITERQVVPNYKVASHLIDATRLLLGHFEGYMGSVPKMRQVRDAVGVLRSQLRQGIIKLFDEVGFPEEHNQRVTRNDDFDENPEENATSSLGLTASPPSALVQSTLADACLVIEALGPESKEEFIAKFVSDHLEEYEQTFNPSPAASAKNKSEPKSFKKDNSKESDAINPMSIDQVDKRFAWYRDFLRSLQVKFGNVFPPHWSMYYRLTASFLERTARHLKFVLKKNGTTIRVVPFTAAPSSGSGASSLVSAKFSATITGASTHGISSSSTHGGSGAGESSAADGEKAVTTLLKALQQTILFEKEMSAWLARDYGTKFLPEASEKKRADDEDALEFDDQGKAVAAGSAEGIRIKYERKKRSGGADAHINGRETGGEQVKPLIGIASVVFDNHMSPYVQLEERTMDEQLHNAQSDNTVDTRGDRPVFVSSTNLFIYMKNSITRCTALTKEKTFFLLQRAFQKKLRDYAKVLEKKLPQPQSQNVAKLALANIQAGGTTTGQASTIYRIPPGEEITICHVIDTCEYCADTVEALEDLIRDKIGAKYKEKVDMSEDQEAFQDVTAKSIRVLVSGLEQRLDTPLKEISKTNWLSFDMVGEESSYVRAIHLTIHPFVTQVRELIPSSYFRSFCDKFATAFASTYYRTLIGLKRISEAGTQQLLLDVYSMKTLLLKLPVLESSKKVPGTRSATTAPSKSLSGGSTIAPAIYTKMVNKDFRKLEVMLKLVGSPKEMLIDMFRAQWDCSIDTNAMAADFQTIMTLKGIPRNEQPALLENLGLEGGDGAVDGSSTMTANMQALQEKGSDVAAKVNADLSQMRARVDDFRKAFSVLVTTAWQISPGRVSRSRHVAHRNILRYGCHDDNVTALEYTRRHILKQISLIVVSPSMLPRVANAEDSTENISTIQAVENVIKEEQELDINLKQQESDEIKSIEDTKNLISEIENEITQATTKSDEDSLIEEEKKIATDTEALIKQEEKIVGETQAMITEIQTMESEVKEIDGGKSIDETTESEEFITKLKQRVGEKEDLISKLKRESELFRDPETGKFKPMSQDEFKNRAIQSEKDYDYLQILKDSLTKNEEFERDIEAFEGLLEKNFGSIIKELKKDADEMGNEVNSIGVIKQIKKLF